MSGRPNTEDIAELHAALSSVKKEGEIIQRSNEEMAQAEQRRSDAEERQVASLRKVDELMARMDVSSPGNAGYKNRLFSLLGGLIDYSESYGYRNG